MTTESFLYQKHKRWCGLMKISCSSQHRIRLVCTVDARRYREPFVTASWSCTSMTSRLMNYKRYCTNELNSLSQDVNASLLSTESCQCCVKRIGCSNRRVLQR